MYLECTHTYVYPSTNLHLASEINEECVIPSRMPRDVQEITSVELKYCPQFASFTCESSCNNYILRLKDIINLNIDEAYYVLDISVDM